MFIKYSQTADVEFVSVFGLLRGGLGNVVSRVSQRSSKIHENEVVDGIKEPMRKDYV